MSAAKNPAPRAIRLRVLLVEDQSPPASCYTSPPTYPASGKPIGR